ncbi:hypothetical protein A9Q84_09750 [Halobacteriovorax marinus]|uniref:Uncharacterized protein n=1 Tax=Halobacteriovorax marinus TaxID=97084 RepID=A0A1Y5FCE6_9BACT|nr:hypothetical protein A9Q84_09750 [Halobacteriovorax marinus]
MNTSITIGLILCALLLFTVIKLVLGLFSESRLLRYDFPTGWGSKILSRYKLCKNLSEKQMPSLQKKIQILVGKNKIDGLEELTVNIDIRLAVAFEMSLLNMKKKTAKLYRNVSPISILPISAYAQFKNRSSHTLYWNDEENSLYLETPTNEFVKHSYYLWLRVDKRFSKFSDQELLDLHIVLAQDCWPSEKHFTQYLGLLGEQEKIEK